MVVRKRKKEWQENIMMINERYWRISKQMLLEEGESGAWYQAARNLGDSLMEMYWQSYRHVYQKEPEWLEV